MSVNQNDLINYSTEVVIDGKQYFQSLAHQLANYICKRTYEEFRLTCEKGFMSATIFIETITQKGELFISTKYGSKKCIGVILYDLDKNRITLRKTNVNRDKHEFHADGTLDDCFGVQYEVFKYLRDGDIIQIHTIERECRKQVACIYRITKMKALKNGRFLHFKGHGRQFFIPVADFHKEVGPVVKKRRSSKKK